jgi:hypothetical protein
VRSRLGFKGWPIAAVAARPSAQTAMEKIDLISISSLRL